MKEDREQFDAWLEDPPEGETTGEKFTDDQAYDDFANAMATLGKKG